MSDQTEQRVVRLLMRDRSGRSLLLDESGELPSIRVQLADEETTMLAACRVVLPELGLRGPVIDCLVDQDSGHDDSGNGSIAALLEVPPPSPEWRLPDGLGWSALVDADPTVEPSLARHLRDRLEEYQGLRPVSELRSPWCKAGWYERASAWIERALADLGRPPPTAIAQVRHWGISAVMRVESGGDRCWFKAVFPPFRNEPVITDFLARDVPGSVPRVVAIDAVERWLLLEDLGSETLARNPAPHRPAIEHLVDVQRSSMARIDQLVAIGCPRRSLVDLPDLLTRTLADPVVEPLLRITGDRADQLAKWLAEAIVRINALGIPETLVHGDFHPGNVAICEGRPVLFDWSDAAISHPLIDVVTWGTWIRDDPEATDALWAMFFESWADVVPVARLESHRETIEAVAGAYHTISYAGILSGLEPCRHPEHADGLTDFFDLLDRAVPPPPN